MTRLALPVAAVFLVGCKHPPEAPGSLDDLCGYLYGHFPDEEPDYLESGLANLASWMGQGDNLDSTFEGYTISNLDQAAVDALDDRDRDLDGILGAAVGTQGTHDPWSITDVFVNVDPVELSPGMYEYYEREFLSDPDCFMAMECDTLHVYNSMQSRYAGVLEVTTDTNGQFRWVEMEGGTAMVQRTWMQDPAQVNMDSIDVQDQFYLNVVMPYDGGSLRLQSTWVVAHLGSGGVPEDMALQLVIGSMQDIYVDVDAWLDENGGAAGSPPEKKGCSTAPVGVFAVWVLPALVARRRRTEPQS